MNKMPLMRFTKLISQVRNHNKIQTMRKPRKRPFKIGDTLHVHISEKLGLATVTSITRKKLSDITEEEALKDGFRSIIDCQQCLMRMHECTTEQEFDIIEFKPFWERQSVMTESELASTIFSVFAKKIRRKKGDENGKKE